MRLVPKSLLTQGNLILCRSPSTQVSQRVWSMNTDFSHTHLSHIWGVANRHTRIAKALTIESHIKLTKKTSLDSGCQGTWVSRVKTLVQAMEARTESDFRAYQEGNKRGEKESKISFYLVREKRQEVDDVPLPEIMNSRTPNKSVQGVLWSLTERGCREISLFSHISHRKITKKKKASILAPQSKTLWGSVFNLEDKTACQTGVGSFVGHMNKLSSTEDIFKRNCSRLRETPPHCSGSSTTQKNKRMTKASGVEPCLMTWERGCFVGSRQLEHEYHIPIQKAFQSGRKGYQVLGKDRQKGTRFMKKLFTEELDNPTEENVNGKTWTDTKTLYVPALKMTNS